MRYNFSKVFVISSKNIYAQIIDDKIRKTLVSSSSLDKSIKEISNLKKIEVSKKVAEILANKATEKKTWNENVERQSLHSTNKKD